MKKLLCILTLLLLGLCFGNPARAQFREEAFSQSYNDDQASEKDSTDVMFSFKEFFGGVAHKNTLKPGTMAFGSALFPGTGQIYNRDYWKLPIVYAGLAGGLAGGFYFKNHDDAKSSRLCFALAGLTYWGMALDEVICYDAEFPSAGKATLYSILVPGLGQIYNGEAWKLPIYWGGLMGSIHFYSLNRTNYERFRRIYKEATGENASSYSGPIQAETALYYRNLYRRYRDYSVLAIAAFYLLQVIDANVFAYMHDFNIGDDITMSVNPTVLTPDNSYAFSPGQSAVGMSLGIRF
ncbi:MAG: hypothetical protein K6F21_06365 [Bacteroidales bacterium]|nr:hypothetical protein [Bacteroidales bacterium]